jgi:hypothetical protein
MLLGPLKNAWHARCKTCRCASRVSAPGGFSVPVGFRGPAGFSAPAGFRAQGGLSLGWFLNPEWFSSSDWFLLIPSPSRVSFQRSEKPHFAPHSRSGDLDQPGPPKVVHAIRKGPQSDRILPRRGAVILVEYPKLPARSPMPRARNVPSFLCLPTLHELPPRKPATSSFLPEAG